MSIYLNHYEDGERQGAGRLFTVFGAIVEEDDPSPPPPTRGSQARGRLGAICREEGITTSPLGETGSGSRGDPILCTYNRAHTLRISTSNKEIVLHGDEIERMKSKKPRRRTLKAR